MMARTLILIAILTASLGFLEAKAKDDAYSFIVGGHLYGAPSNKKSQYPSSSLLANIDLINKIKGAGGDRAEFFVSLGDNVRLCNKKQFANFKASVIDKLDMPFHNALGNHDVKKRGVYESSMLPALAEQKNTFYNFIESGDMHIVLDSELDPKGIVGAQLDFLLKSLDQAAKDSKISNIFIYSHRLLWANSDHKFAVVLDNVNNKEAYQELIRSNSFKNTIKTKLMALSDKKPIYWFSGDIGGHKTLTLFHHRFITKKLHYLAVGLGDRDDDFLLQVNVDKNKEVTIEPLALGSAESLHIDSYGLEAWKYAFHTETHSNFWNGLFRR